MKAGKKKDEDEAELNASRPAILEAVPRDYSVQFDFPEPTPLSIPVIQVKDVRVIYCTVPVMLFYASLPSHFSDFLVLWIQVSSSLA